MLIVEQKAQILPILELLIEAKEEHLLECFGLMLMYYSKFRTMSTQMPLSSIDESSVMQDQAGANVGQFVVLTEMVSMRCRRCTCVRSELGAGLTIESDNRPRKSTRDDAQMRVFVPERTCFATKI